MEKEREEELKIGEIGIDEIEIEVDGEKIDLDNFKGWYVWVPEEKDSIFDEELNKGSE